MKRIAALLFLLALLALASSAMAGDSGSYYDPARSGEGIVLQRNGDQVVTFLFTYGAEICGLPIPPIPSPEPPVLPDDCQSIGQRWFFGADEIVGDVVSGLLFATEGLEDAEVAGTEFPVGAYTLVRDGDGWIMSVVPFGSELPPNDPLFRLYDFSSLLFESVD